MPVPRLPPPLPREHGLAMRTTVMREESKETWMETWVVLVARTTRG